MRLSTFATGTLTGAAILMVLGAPLSTPMIFLTSAMIFGVMAAFDPNTMRHPWYSRASWGGFYDAGFLPIVRLFDPRSRRSPILVGQHHEVRQPAAALFSIPSVALSIDNLQPPASAQSGILMGTHQEIHSAAPPQPILMGTYQKTNSKPPKAARTPTPPVLTATRQEIHHAPKQSVLTGTHQEIRSAASPQPILTATHQEIRSAASPTPVLMGSRQVVRR